MKYLILFISLLLVGCGTKKEIPPEIKTVTVEKVVEREKIIHDTIQYALPQQYKERETQGDSSYLENDYAYSSASVDSAGVLHHTLGTKDRPLDIPVEHKEKSRDSIRVDSIRVPTPYPVEMPLKWQERLAIETYPYILAALLLIVLWLLRKPIIRCIRKAH